ncbi:MBL fold metallo-hydrolase [Niabella terrae]
MHLPRKYGTRPDKQQKKFFDTLFNYQKGQFQNQVPTPALAEGATMTGVLLNFLRQHPHGRPSRPLPSVVTDLTSLPLQDNLLVWFGHSSYYLQVDGLRILMDPVFSGQASPVQGSVKAFPGTNNYQVSDLPDIDLLLISHDHWDHLDYRTIRQLRPLVRQVLCGWGVGSHFRHWGYDPAIVVEKNWYDCFSPRPGIELRLTPARHFSGRGLKRNGSLWTSFVLTTPTKNIFLGGDSGYGPHFQEIGKRWGPFDWAIMETGQYNDTWPYIHSLPEEVIREVQELRARNFIPVHHSKFRLALHPWYEPLQRITALATDAGLPVTTPRIGEIVSLDNYQSWEKWWQEFLPKVDD